MSDINLPQLNSVLRLNGNDLKRIIYNDNSRKLIYTIQLDTTKTNIESFSYNQMRSLLSAGLVTLVDDPMVLIHDYDCLSEAKKNILNKAYSVVKQLFSNDFYDMINAPNIEVFSSIAKSNNVSLKTIYKYFRMYLQGGMVKSALLPQFSNCGRPGKSKNVKIKMGRKYTNSDIIGIIINDKIKEEFDNVIKNYFYKQENASLKNAYEYLIRHYYCVSVMNYKGLEEKVPKSVNEIPSYAQFRNYYYKNRNPKEQLITKLGNAKFYNKYKYLSSDVIFESRFAGNIYEIDATIANFYLISEFKPDKVIGRPIVYFLVDSFTGMITGFNVSLSSPSWDNAATAIYNATENKIDFCKNFDIDIEENDWPAMGCPNILLCDNGEVSKTLSNDVCKMLNIEIANTRSYRGSD